MLSKKYLVKKSCLRFLVGKKTVTIPSWQKKFAKNISCKLILVTNQKFSHFITGFTYR